MCTIIIAIDVVRLLYFRMFLENINLNTNLTHWGREEMAAILQRTYTYVKYIFFNKIHYILIQV